MGTALLMLVLGTRWGWVVNTMPQQIYPQEGDPVPKVHKVGLALGLVWSGVGYSKPTGVRTPNHPAHNKSLYLLQYPTCCVQHPMF